MNAVFPNGPVTQFIHISDGHLLMRICCKLQGKEECEKLMSLPLDSKVEIIFSILHTVLNLSSSSESSIDSPFFTGDESWFFGPCRVQYQRLLTVACTSVRWVPGLMFNFSNGRLREQLMSDDIHLLQVPETWQDTSVDSSDSMFNADR
ncbi:hypothetical protein E1301_Tti017028 [Triplophysa tibetana]|uniref:Nuclear mitotic apparatus protein 1 N-terminal hook domain-containing protein n=1 Tax=Triplophysa tibetana TaxID=1572043 RepID=A0A5A9MYK5_9TELE|nr:hypothetical protein E1301_Tti017028 [Triplophysa tibetana]